MIIRSDIANCSFLSDVGEIKLGRAVSSDIQMMDKMSNNYNRQNHYHVTSFQVPSSSYILTNTDPMSCVVPKLPHIEEEGNVSSTEHELFGQTAPSPWTFQEPQPLFSPENTSDPTFASLSNALIPKERETNEISTWDISLEMDDYEKNFVEEDVSSLLMDWGIAQETETDNITKVVENCDLDFIGQSEATFPPHGPAVAQQLEKHDRQTEMMDKMAKAEIELCNRQFYLHSEKFNGGNMKPGRNSSMVMSKLGAAQRRKIMRRKKQYSQKPQNMVIARKVGFMSLLQKLHGTRMKQAKDGITPHGENNEQLKTLDESLAAMAQPNYTSESEIIGNDVKMFIKRKIVNKVRPKMEFKKVHDILMEHNYAKLPRVLKMRRMY